MKKYNYVLSVAVLVYILVGGAFTTSLSAQGKVGVIDLTGAIAGTKHFNKRISALEQDSEFIRLRQSGEELYNQRTTYTETLQRDGELMSDAEIREMQTRVQENAQELQFVNSKLQKRQEQLWDSTSAELRDFVEQATTELIEAHGIDVLLDAKQIVWYKQDLNLTPELAKAIDQLVEQSGLE